MCKTLFVLLMCCSFLGCTTFKPVVKTSADIESFHPIANKKYRVVTNNGTTIETAGSDIKIMNGNIYVGPSKSLPINDVSSIEIKKIKKGVIIGSIVGGVVAALAVGGVVLWAQWVKGDDK